MIDSHVLVGSCAQIGARVHLAAGVTIGGVLEPGARPVIVEDDAFVGAGSALLDGVLLGRGAVIGAGVTLTGVALVRPGRASVSIGTADAPLAVRRVPSSCRALGPSPVRSQRRTACRWRSPCSSRTAIQARAPGVALEAALR